MYKIYENHSSIYTNLLTFLNDYHRLLSRFGGGRYGSDKDWSSPHNSLEHTEARRAPPPPPPPELKPGPPPPPPPPPSSPELELGDSTAAATADSCCGKLSAIARLLSPGRTDEQDVEEFFFDFSATPPPFLQIV